MEQSEYFGSLRTLGLILELCAVCNLPCIVLYMPMPYGSRLNEPLNLLCVCACVCVCLCVYMCVSVRTISAIAVVYGQYTNLLENGKRLRAKILSLN